VIIIIKFVERHMPSYRGADIFITNLHLRLATLPECLVLTSVNDAAVQWYLQ